MCCLLCQSEIEWWFIVKSSSMSFILLVLIFYSSFIFWSFIYSTHVVTLQYSCPIGAITPTESVLLAWWWYSSEWKKSRVMVCGFSSVAHWIHLENLCRGLMPWANHRLALGIKLLTQWKYDWPKNVLICERPHCWCLACFSPWIPNCAFYSCLSPKTCCKFFRLMTHLLGNLWFLFISVRC